MKKIVFWSACALVVGAAWALPPRSEVAQAEGGIAAIVSDIEKRAEGDVGKVAFELVALEGKAGSAAEKFVLRREAMWRYLKVAWVNQASGILEACVKEDDPAAVGVLNDYAEKKLSFKEKRALKSAADYKAYEAMVKSAAVLSKEKTAAENRLKELEVAVAKSPKNVKAQEQLGIEYVLRGEWEKALGHLAQVKGALGEAAKLEVAKPEAKGNEAVAIGDAWWKVEGKEISKKVTAACQVHAATWYRTAMVDEKVSNLVKVRIGGRIEDADRVAVAQAESAEFGKTAAGVAVKGKGGDTIKIALDSKGSVFLELAVCEPGTFKMYKGRTEFFRREHDVTLTYPYLMLKGRLTYGMVKAVNRKVWKNRMEKIRTEEEKFYGDGQAIDGLCDSELEEIIFKLNTIAAKCRELKDYKGYEFRLPTEAEWTRAYFAGTDDYMDVITEKELKEYWKKRGNPNWKLAIPDADVAGVLKKKANAWGVGNMSRDMEEMVDTVAMPLKKDGSRIPWNLGECDRDIFKYAEKEVDPIRVCTDKNACHIRRIGDHSKDVRSIMVVGGKGQVVGGEQKGGYIRLVFAPKVEKLTVYPKK